MPEATGSRTRASFDAASADAAANTSDSSRSDRTATSESPTLIERALDVFDAFIDYVLTLLRLHQAKLAKEAGSFARRAALIFGGFVLGLVGLCLLLGALLDELTVLTGSRAAGRALAGLAALALCAIMIGLANLGARRERT